MAGNVNYFYRDRYKIMEQPRKRGRPRTLDREVGLDVAMRLFWQHGYEGTSIADLTKAMGITPPSLYATFGSKEELYRQAVEYHVSHLGQQRADALQAAGSAYEALDFYLHDAARAFVDPANPPGCMVSTAVLQHAEESAGAASAVAERRDSTLQFMKLRFDRAVEDGELPGGTDTRALAHFYGAIVQGMSAQACDGVCAKTLDDIATVALSAWPGKKP